jgi:hypothetical protein
MPSPLALRLRHDFRQPESTRHLMPKVSRSGNTALHRPRTQFHHT